MGEDATTFTRTSLYVSASRIVYLVKPCRIPCRSTGICAVSIAAGDAIQPSVVRLPPTSRDGRHCLSARSAFTRHAGDTGPPSPLAAKCLRSFLLLRVVTTSYFLVYELQRHKRKECAHRDLLPVLSDHPNHRRLASWIVNVLQAPGKRGGRGGGGICFKANTV